MRRGLVAALLVAALGAAVGVYVTSTRPDGLERVTTDLGLTGSDATAAGAGAGDHGGSSARARRSALALLGALAAGGVALGAGRLLARGRRPRRPGG